ncbi:hypothetical protein BH23ACT12_BH23ACT12_09350 [soil metagenome]
MSRRLRLVSMLLALVLLAACGGEEEPASRPTNTTLASPSQSPSPAEVSPSVPAPSPSAAPAPPAPAPRPAPAPPPPPAPAPAQPVTGPAAPGQYIFDESGQVGTQGCLVANQPPPTPTRLNVGPVNGNRQTLDRDQTGSGTVGSVSNLTLEYREDGAYVVSLRQEQRVNGQVLAFDFQTPNPQRLIPAFPQVGDTGGFSLTSSNGQVRVDAGSTVEAVNENVTLGQGATLKTVRIRTTSTIGGVSPQGSLNLQVTRTSWYSVDKHIEVKDVTDTTGTVGLCRVNFHVESLARSV